MAKIAVISICSVVVVAMVIAIAAGVYQHHNKHDDVESTKRAVKAMCQTTDHIQTCEQSLSSAKSPDPKELIKTGFLATITEIRQAIAKSSTMKELAKDPMAKQALKICDEVMNDAIDDINKSVKQIGEFDLSKVDEYIKLNLKVWLCGATTFLETCSDAFVNTTGEAEEKMKKILKTSKELTSNALAMVSQISSINKNLDIKQSDGLSNTQRRLFSEYKKLPSWVSRGQRILLQSPSADIKSNVVVAQDGSGNFLTINEALKQVPLNNPNKFVIYIKAGVYKEIVVVTKEMSNVVFIGDGPTKTKITGSLNYADGTKTFDTSTVAIVGDRFMAKDIGFENSAGAIKHQAVALRVQSDQSIFHNCQMDGYQDTLYALAHRQYYRDCIITGTVDFIFGDSLAVFQNCNMIVKKPMDKQNCMVTAQGRIEIREVTALVLQNCVISGEPAFVAAKGTNKAYLGRPWKAFSKTIIMQSQIDDIIDPAGWKEWNGTFGLDTLWYAEFENRGAGADTSQRVKWKGIQHIDATMAESFTTSKFLEGDVWIPSSGVPYTPGMFPRP